MNLILLCFALAQGARIEFTYIQGQLIYENGSATYGTAWVKANNDKVLLDAIEYLARPETTERCRDMSASVIARAPMVDAAFEKYVKS